MSPRGPRLIHEREDYLRHYYSSVVIGGSIKGDPGDHQLIKIIPKNDTARAPPLELIFSGILLFDV